MTRAGSAEISERELGRARCLHVTAVSVGSFRKDYIGALTEGGWDTAPWWHTDPWVSHRPLGGTQTPWVTLTPGPRTPQARLRGCRMDRAEAHALLHAVSNCPPIPVLGENTTGVPSAKLGTCGGCVSLMPVLKELWLRGAMLGLV